MVSGWSIFFWVIGIIGMILLVVGMMGIAVSYSESNYITKTVPCYDANHNMIKDISCVDKTYSFDWWQCYFILGVLLFGWGFGLGRMFE